ncbi:MAG: TetR/AcrR family transcriptional regulator [Chloroflexia bacterium]|nr:TetR/AcrR family transcriptional regulator [Chloroflexia bacterium]
MGHREKLLAGAKRCLYERGYGRTTARDIVEVSGTNLASIGYHFGSKEALLNAAMMESIEDWGAELERVLRADADADAVANPMERFESMWARVIESFAAHRPALAASFEAFTQAEHSPELRQQLADAHEEVRPWFATLFQKMESTADEGSVRAVGSFHLALLNGLMVQWLLDPERAPSGREMADALRTILTSVQST